MIASTSLRIIVRVVRWSSTGNATARPDWCSTPPVSRGALPKYRENIAQPAPISLSGALDHTTTAPHRSVSNLHATAKSP
jgi:hypothetical protein